MRTFVRVFVAATILSSATALFAQQPTVLHGQVTTEAASHGLGAVIDSLKKQKDVVWVGYSIPVVNKFSSGWNSSRIDYLEGKNDAVADDSQGNDHSSDHALILLRIADGGVTKLHVESPERELDAGGLRFVWLNGIEPDDSVHVLTDLARQEDARHLARTIEAGGHDGVEVRVRTAYEKWVKENGNIFRLRDGVDGHHDTIKLRWEMLPAAGGEVISIGFDFLVLGGDGRIRTGYQFIEA